MLRSIAPSSRFSLFAVGLALFAAACADPVSAPRSLAAGGRALGATVPSLPGQPAGSTAIPFSSSGTVHYCGYLNVVTQGVAAFPGTDCATNAINLTTVAGGLGSYNPGWTVVGGGNNNAPLFNNSALGAAWLGVPATGGTSNEYKADPGTYEFIATFSLPTGATSPSLQMSLMSDNAIRVYLNGTAIGGNAVVQDCTTPLSCNWNIKLNVDNSPATFNFGATLNILRIDLTDTRIGYNATTGADNCATFNIDAFAPHFNSPYNRTTCQNPAGVGFAGVAYYFPPVTTTWCSPGYWKNHVDSWPAGYTTKLYNSFSGQYAHDPQTVPGNPTLLTVISNPSTYKGPATNNVADILSKVVFGTPIGSGVERCPLN